MQIKILVIQLLNAVSTANKRIKCFHLQGTYTTMSNVRWGERSVSGYEYGYEGPRAVDIDDLILNTTGCVIGILFFMIYKKLFYKSTLRH